MSRSMGGVVVVAAILVAACATAPDRSIEIAANAAAPATANAAGRADVEPDLVVDAKDPAPDSRVVCRDLLKQGSNVIVTRCMTGADWRRFDWLQERNAQSIVRMLQGGAYR